MLLNLCGLFQKRLFLQFKRSLASPMQTHVGKVTIAVLQLLPFSPNATVASLPETIPLYYNVFTLTVPFTRIITFTFIIYIHIVFTVAFHLSHSLQILLWCGCQKQFCNVICTCICTFICICIFICRYPYLQIFLCSSILCKSDCGVVARNKSVARYFCLNLYL